MYPPVPIPIFVFESQATLLNAACGARNNIAITMLRKPFL